MFNQTFQDFEIIVVDDASTDNTEDVVKSFEDERIEYIRHKENKGGGAARNTGIKKARGKFIAFLDSDDWWSSTKLEQQILIIQNRDIDLGLVYTGLKYVDLKGRVKKEKIPHFKGNILNELLIKNVVGTSSAALVKKDLFNEVGLFDENLPSRQDLDLWIRIARNYTFDYVKAPLTYFTLHKNRITSDLKKKIRGRELLLNKIYTNLKKDKRKLAKYYYEFGILYFQAGDMSSGRKYMIKALTAFPHFKTLLALSVSLLGDWWFGLALRFNRILNVIILGKSSVLRKKFHNFLKEK